METMAIHRTLQRRAEPLAPNALTPPPEAGICRPNFLVLRTTHIVFPGDCSPVFGKGLASRKRSGAAILRLHSAGTASPPPAVEWMPMTHSHPPEIATNGWLR